MHPDIQYLQTVNIVRLQSAARMAGLRWKSGTPGFDKAGIINKLEQSPSILRATVAALRRMEKGKTQPTQRPPSSLLADLDDELQGLQGPGLAQPNPAPTEFCESPDITNLRGNLDSLAKAVVDLQQNAAVQARDIASIKATHAHDFQALDAALTAQNAQITAQAAEIAALKTRQPVDVHIPALPPIHLTGSEHRSYRKLLTYLHLNRRVILTGSAGTGKSRAVADAARHFGLPFYLQTPITQDNQYLGYRDATGVFHDTPTFRAYTQGGLLLWDEADASLADAILGANPIFDGNGFATFGDGELHSQHTDFLVVFNMNTSGHGSTMQYAGRTRLDGATLDRFGVAIQWDIDPDIETGMAQNQDTWLAAVRAVRAFMARRDIVDVNATPRRVKAGAQLLTAGCPRHEVLVDVLKNGALSECWGDVERLPEVAKFLSGA